MAERTPAIGFAWAAPDVVRRLDEAARAWDEAIAVGRRAGERPWVSFSCCFAPRSRCGRAICRRPRSARGSPSRPPSCGTCTPPDPAAFLCEALIERGRVGRGGGGPGGQWLRPRAAGRQGYNPLLFSRAQLHLARGPRTRRRRPRELGRRLEAQTILNPAAFAWRSLLARALSRLRSRAARELATEELERARAFGAPRAIAVALQGLALVSRGEEQAEHLREALDVLDGSPARLERARATVELGAALRRQGLNRDAREVLQRRARAGRRCGADALAARASDELATAGARPRRDALRGRDSLTASEARIAGWPPTG